MSQRLRTFLKLNPYLISPSQGLYHGKDVQFGKSIAPHSKTKTLKKWLPNVINKRVWSETLDDWVRFKMTTTALKKIDYIGGIDNYLLSLDNKSVALSNYITKMRNIIGTSLFLKGELSPLYIRKLGYGKNPPVAPVAVAPTSSEDDEVVHFE
jgi:ribosomal protein L28